jgi:hypothetical protein
MRRESLVRLTPVGPSSVVPHTRAGVRSRGLGPADGQRAGSTGPVRHRCIRCAPRLGAGEGGVITPMYKEGLLLVGTVDFERETEL